METKISNVRRTCEFFNGIDISSNGSRSLYLTWKENIIINLRGFSRSHVDI